MCIYVCITYTYTYIYIYTHASPPKVPEDQPLGSRGSAKMARSTTTIWLANRLGHADHRFTQPGANLWCWLGLIYMCRCIVIDVDDIAELVLEILYLPFWQRWWKDAGRNWHVWPHCARALRRTSWVEPRQQFQWPSRFQWPNQALKWWLWKGNYSKIARIEVDGWDNWDKVFKASTVYSPLNSSRKVDKQARGWYDFDA